MVSRGPAEHVVFLPLVLCNLLVGRVEIESSIHIMVSIEILDMECMEMFIAFIVLDGCLYLRDFFWYCDHNCCFLIAKLW